MSKSPQLDAETESVMKQVMYFMLHILCRNCYIDNFLMLYWVTNDSFADISFFIHCSKCL